MKLSTLTSWRARRLSLLKKCRSTMPITHRTIKSTMSISVHLLVSTMPKSHSLPTKLTTMPTKSQKLEVFTQDSMLRALMNRVCRGARIRTTLTKASTALTCKSRTSNRAKRFLLMIASSNWKSKVLQRTCWLGRSLVRRSSLWRKKKQPEPRSKEVVMGNTWTWAKSRL